VSRAFRLTALLLLVVFTGSVTCALACPKVEATSNVCPKHGKPDCCGDSGSDKHPCNQCIDTHFAPGLKQAVAPFYMVVAHLQTHLENAILAPSFLSEPLSIGLRGPAGPTVLRI
jgi:hypothetical protein